MDDKKNRKKRRGLPTQMNLMIHIVAGAYLIYLAYNIYSSAGAAAGNEKIVMPLAAVLFGVIGIVIILSALRSLIKGEYEGGAGDRNRGNKEEEPGTKAGENSGERRIRFDEDEETSEESADRN